MTSRLRAPARISCGSRLSISSSEPARSLIVRPLTRALPLPETTYSHCSAHACSFAELSLLDVPGASVIVAACELRV